MNKCDNCHEVTSMLFTVVTYEGRKMWCGHCTNATTACEVCGTRSRTEVTPSLYNPARKCHDSVCPNCIAGLMRAAQNWLHLPEPLQEMFDGAR